MESLAAVGLAGNIIQFISFASVLVSKSREIHQSAGGATKESVDLEAICKDIREISSKISSSTRQSPGLQAIVTRCREVAIELQDAVSELRFKPGKASLPTKWKSFRQAFKFVLGTKRLEDFKSRLSTLTNQVVMHLVSDTHGDQIHLVRELEAFKKLNAQTGYRVTKNLSALNDQLQLNQKYLVNLHDDGYWTDLRNNFHQVITKANEISQNHNIIASLRYDCMELRHDAIHHAHRRTFDWIFQPESFAKSDPRSSINWTEWLEQGTGIYWVTGKPGCGKSTLMKYLYSHPATKSHLLRWTGNLPLTKVSFYFWNPGQQMQKSLEGLLRTLLYQILDACPHLVPILGSKKLNKGSHQYNRGSLIGWSLIGLQEALTKFITQPDVSNNFYFHIDGLDEYSGDTSEVIEILQRLSTAPHVKICLSSRPWNCFQDAFGRQTTYMLRLHDLTKEDMELFARESLQRYSQDSDFDDKLFESLVHDLRDRAQGVFLWVRLAVRSLRDGIINGDPMSLLHERLLEIPTDLEEFFELILSSVEPIYRTRMAMTFLAALKTPTALNLIQYHFLDQDERALDMASKSKRFSDDQIQKFVHQTQRRLNGRFKGLLEPTSSDAIHHRTKVEFLHRTLRDFLLREPMKGTLDTWAPKNWDPLLAISRAFLSETKYVHPQTNNIIEAARLVDLALQETENPVQCFMTLDQVELALLQCSVGLSGCMSSDFMVRVAISIGHTGYQNYRVQKDGIMRNLDQLLHHAITCSIGPDTSFGDFLSYVIDRNYRQECHGVSSSYCFEEARLFSNGGHFIPSPSMVKLLVYLGANPGHSWETFIHDLPTLMDNDPGEKGWEVLSILLQSRKIDLTHPSTQWTKIIDRSSNRSDYGMRNTLKYFKLLFQHGLNPNLRCDSGSLIGSLIRTFSFMSHDHADREDMLDLRTQILHEFFSHGARIAEIYDTQRPDSWAQMVSQINPIAMSTRIFEVLTADLGVFFQYGLAPNTPVCKTATFWETLLSFLSGILPLPENSHTEIIPEEGISNMLRICLHYGADPYVVELDYVTKRMRPGANLTVMSRLDAVLRTERQRVQLDTNNRQASMGYHGRHANFVNGEHRTHSAFRRKREPGYIHHSREYTRSSSHWPRNQGKRARLT